LGGWASAHPPSFLCVFIFLEGVGIMPLKIRVKPEGKIFAGGAVLKNVGNRPADLLILSDSPVLREDYMMNIDRSNDSDASNVYFLLQVVYLFKGKGQPMDRLVIETIKNFGKLHPHLIQDINQVITHLEAGESFKALKIAHKLLAEQNKAAPPELATPQAAVPAFVEAH
jgi:flagellar biosynthesis regulator FlbT